jgi:hypothetical protein
MSFTLYFAATSMFNGPGKPLWPQPLQDSGLLFIPEFTVLGLAAFWLWKTLRTPRLIA